MSEKDAKKRVIAIVGKGGTGKTMTTAIMAKVIARSKKYRLFLIDADPAWAHLASVLGLEVKRTLEDIRNEVIDVAERRIQEEKVEMVRSLDYKMFDALIEGEEFSLLVMGRPEGPGCFCPANVLLRKSIETLSKHFDIILIDCEAGLEHINRKAIRSIDTLLIITDPTIRGVRTAEAISKVSDKFTQSKIKGLVINRVKGNADSIIEYANKIGLDVIGLIPEDPFITNLDNSGGTLKTLPENSKTIKEIEDILKNIGIQL
ncbi:MAG: nucleotide-binding protein [Candidatus Helarchaeota archaeon]